MSVHDSDLDGVGSRVVVEYYLNDICDITYLNTAKRDMSEFNMPLAMQSEIIIFTDITPTLELYELLEKEGKEIFIFDHHQSGRDILGERNNYYFNIEKCGCKILYDVLSKEIRKNRVLDRFVYLVNTYDLWKQNSKDWQEAKGLHNSMYGSVNWKLKDIQTDTEKFEIFIINQLKKCFFDTTFHFIENELNAIERAKKKEITAYNEAKRSLRIRKDGEGNNYGWFSCTSKLSFTANRLLSEYGDKLDYVVGYSTWDKKNRSISLRSNGSFDVTRIAEKHFGGGHFNSAGIEFESQDIIKKIENGKMHLL